MDRHRILNIAHMGRVDNSSPPSTILGLKKAIMAGVDGVEFDIHETKDHHFILHHDYKLPIGNVKELTLLEIQKFKSDERLEIAPKLEEALELCKNAIKMMIEIKHIWSIKDFLGILRKNETIDDIMITSFFHSIIKEISILDARLNLGIITSSYLVDPAHAIRSANAKFILNQYPLIDEKCVSEIHKKDLSVYVWNIKEEKDLKEVINLGVDGIVSDNPMLLKSLLTCFHD